MRPTPSCNGELLKYCKKWSLELFPRPKYKNSWWRSSIQFMMESLAQMNKHRQFCLQSNSKGWLKQAESHWNTISYQSHLQLQTSYQKQDNRAKKRWCSMNITKLNYWLRKKANLSTRKQEWWCQTNKLRPLKSNIARNPSKYLKKLW